MKTIKRPVNCHLAYHAHVYFERKTLVLATALCAQVGERFNVKIGRVHQKTVGPHPMWSCQVIFAAKHFDDLVPWLDENRQGLTVLVHGLTGNDLDDHTIYAYWLGDSVELNVSMFAG